ncbi:uncharacterized protein MONBRDRAFT_38265 [Monosiga brevicollis MX1]|uniref:Protein-tyrosine-phosphatase n=1 Tax=Monosiga brevicollis TaxID=81824 RepID=A9V6T9_MONBE|nr:uncharacterized protein MONBRDRAFT_38265 [Monosiga brevicollis MX1]EDQ86792.1 predicted protein [Monosiga brevicollis MX1]|eukprot:XP_001748337.1 hypothetical protein [Monosiga brevicollis MX1]
MPKLRRSGSSNSLASLTSRGSQKIHVPAVKGSDFLEPAEMQERGTFHIAPLDTARFKRISQNVQPHSAVPEAVRNKRFNRHMDVLPHPETRVQLPTIGNDPASAYINANYVHGPSGSDREYICAMGPLPATLKNWWRMIWQEKVTCILMATGLVEKGTKKCERYWAPKPGQKVKVADMFVRTLATSQGDGYVRTLLEIEHTSGESRKVMHFWYNTWPDHGVPRTPDGKPDASNLLYMIRDSKRSEKELNQGGPVLTHCSAGVGRSGTIIALDYICRLLETNKHADLNLVIEEIRRDRVALVQHPQQYELAHAGAILYAQYVQANLDVDERAINAPFLLQATPQGSADAMSVKGISPSPAPAAADDDDLDDNAVDDDGVYGAPVNAAAATASSAPVAPAASAESSYGAPVPSSATQASSPYGAPVTTAAGNPDDNLVYGAPVQGSATGATASGMPPANAGMPASDDLVYGAPVQSSAAAGAEPAEYSVMTGTVVAQMISTYESADDPTRVPEGAVRTPVTQPNNLIYGDEGSAAAATTPAPTATSQPTYGNDDPAANPEQMEEIYGNDNPANNPEQMEEIYGNDIPANNPEQMEDIYGTADAPTAVQGASPKGTVPEGDDGYGFFAGGTTDEPDRASPNSKRQQKESQAALLQAEREQLEAMIRRCKQSKSEAERNAKAIKQRMQAKEEEIRDLTERINHAQSSQLAMREELMRQKMEGRAQVVVQALGLTPSTSAAKERQAKLMMMCLSPAKSGGRVATAGPRTIVSDKKANEAAKEAAADELTLLSAAAIAYRV